MVLRSEARCNAPWRTLCVRRDYDLSASVFRRQTPHRLGQLGRDHIGMRRAANRRDLCAERFGDLHGESSHTARDAVY